MTRLEYDATTGYLQSIGWALPGILETDPAWRIARLVFTGELLTDVRWADGDDAFDNVWADRATLSYGSNPDLTLGTAVAEIFPNGPRPGFVFDLGSAIGPLLHEVAVNALPYRRVSAVPGVNEYAIAGTTLTVGGDVGIAVADDVRVRVWL